MRKGGLCCGPVYVHPSVCLSVTFMHSIQTAEDIFKLLCRPGSPIIPDFLPRRFSGGGKYNGVGKFCDFRLKSPSIWETVQDRPMVAMEL